MKTLQEFLNEEKIGNITKEIELSSRIKDEKGVPYKFKIKSLNFEDVSEIKRKCTSSKLDFYKFELEIVIAGTVYPNFKDAESIKAVGAVTPQQYINTVLNAGEVTKLSDEIQKISGYFDNMNELVDEAKN